MVPDQAVRDTLDGSYEVMSLYYDSPRFYYFWEKIDGVSRRKKVRLRTYRKNGSLGEQVFFEIKRKHDAVILKDRFPLTEDAYRTLTENGNFYGVESLENGNTKRVIDEFHMDRGRHMLAPKLLVVYNREPYLGRYNKHLRITFDYEIRARSGDNLLYTGSDYNDVSGANVIMELKFQGMLPFYVADVIRQFELTRVPYSKYCEGLEASYGLPQLSVLGGHSQSDTLKLTRNNLLPL